MDYNIDNLDNLKILVLIINDVIILVYYFITLDLLKLIFLNLRRYTETLPCNTSTWSTVTEKDKHRAQQAAHAAPTAVIKNDLINCNNENSNVSNKLHNI